MIPSRFRRSPREFAFRLRQEAVNLALFASPPNPTLAQDTTPLPDPDPILDALAGSSFFTAVCGIADEVLAGRFPVLGLSLSPGPPLDWRRDWVYGQITPPDYFRRVPYLNFAAAGDHKIIWEPNRHQHLIILVQAWRWTARPELIAAIATHLNSWIDQNPPQRGINWTSALEVAFRALSWIWVWHIGGPSLRAALPADTISRWLRSLYIHGCHIEANLSVYFSPNTHLLGEAVILDALGRCFPSWPRSAHWRSTGSLITDKQLDSQVLADGAHFELSSYYHIYALDFFLFHALIAGRLDEPRWRERLGAMARFLQALLGTAKHMPFIGDDDGGRLFHPYGDPSAYGRATLTTAALALDSTELPVSFDDVCQQAAWWMGKRVLDQPRPGSPPPSAHFPDSGLTIYNTKRLQIIADAGGFGPFRAGHSHADALQLILTLEGEEILIDPATYTYIADPAWRDRFRSAAMHNTVSIDGHAQAVPVNPFAWDGRPSVQLLRFDSSSSAVFWSAVCETAGARHVRFWSLSGHDVLFLCDSVEILSGQPAGIWQNWHFPSTTASERLLLPAGSGEIRRQEGEEYGWRSLAFGQKTEAPFIGVHRHAVRAVLPAAIWLAPLPAPPLEVFSTEGSLSLAAGQFSVTIPLASLQQRKQ